MNTDTQSTVERTFRAIVPALCGASVIAGMGHMEHCYTYDPVLLVQDDDLIGMLRRLMRGIEVTDETLGMDAIMRVGPGANYLIDEHTLKHFKTEYWTPKATNRYVRNAWKMKGAPDANEIARERARKILAEHKAEPLDPKLVEELDRIVASANEAAARGELTHAHGGGSIGSLVSTYKKE
jgi:trimethylamine--corrinoid protein Co-methyltransferase